MITLPFNKAILDGYFQTAFFARMDHDSVAVSAPIANCGWIKLATASGEFRGPAYKTFPAPEAAVPIATCVIVAPVTPQAGNWTSAALEAAPLATVQPPTVLATATLV